MLELGTIGIIIIIINAVFSFSAFENIPLFQKYKFHVGSILSKKEHIRMFSSGFLHVNVGHLLFNMFSFYSFAGILEYRLGAFSFLLIYIASLLMGNLFALFLHKNNPHYSAVGASGAVSGIIFASIALFPNIGIGILFIPFHIPSWLFALLYVGYSVYGIKTNNDNIGHEAHLGGAIIGMLLAVLMHPSALIENYRPILLTFIPTILFMYYIIKNPTKFSS